MDRAAGTAGGRVAVRGRQDRSLVASDDGTNKIGGALLGRVGLLLEFEGAHAENPMFRKARTWAPLNLTRRECPMEFGVSVDGTPAQVDGHFSKSVTRVGRKNGLRKKRDRLGHPANSFMELDEVAADIADALVRVDTSRNPFRGFQPGVGPYGEPQVVKRIVACMNELDRYHNSALAKRTPDLLIPGEWQSKSRSPVLTATMTRRRSTGQSTCCTRIPETSAQSEIATS